MNTYFPGQHRRDSELPSELGDGYSEDDSGEERPRGGKGKGKADGDGKEKKGTINRVNRACVSAVPIL